MDDNVVRKSVREIIRKNVEVYCSRANVDYQTLADLLVGLGITALVDWAVRSGESREGLADRMRTIFDGLLEDCPVLYEEGQSLASGADPDLLDDAAGNA